MIRWPRSAVVAIITLSVLLLGESLLWVTGRRPWDDPWDPQVVGSLGEWAAGIAMAAIKQDRTSIGALTCRDQLKRHLAPSLAI